MATRAELGISHWAVKEGFVQALESALELGDERKADEVLNAISNLAPGESSPYLRAQAARLAGRLAARRGDVEAAGRSLAAAEAGFRDLGAEFYLAVSLLERAECLPGERAADMEPMLGEAEGIFSKLRATPWLDRLRAARARQGDDALAGA